MSFKNAVKEDLNNEMTTTKNGMPSFVTTNSKVLDFFGRVGSSRGLDLSALFISALNENEDLALRALQWTRDVRGGAGERKMFRDLLSRLEQKDSALAGKLMHKIPVVGRWDDLMTYSDPINVKNAVEFYCDALKDGNGLAFKWAPREKSNVAYKRAFAKKLMTALGMTPKQYRKFLVEGTDVVESKMCAKDWDNINFSHVPSLASARYQKAFSKNAGEKYSAYIQELQKPVSERNPKVKVNAGAVYPYDVVKSVNNGRKDVADEQWKALPNYMGDSKVLPMVDVSGSMAWSNLGNSGLTPIDVAVSLGLYCSDKTSSAFKDLFLTFSSNPEFVQVSGSLSDKIAQMKRANWQGSTNMLAAFELVLDTAQRHDISQDDMPDAILILSDMQFNMCTRNASETALKGIRVRYENAGYQMPAIVFWNLNGGYGEDTPVKVNDDGTALVSGFSPAILETVLGADFEKFNPYNIMLDTLMKERYAL